MPEVTNNDVSRSTDELSTATLQAVLHGFNEAELAELEDDLNLASFAGIVTDRIRAILDKIGV